MLDFLQLLDDLEKEVNTHDEIVHRLLHIQNIQGILCRHRFTASIQQAISEKLLETEGDLKCQGAKMANGGDLCHYLIAEQAI